MSNPKINISKSYENASLINKTDFTEGEKAITDFFNGLLEDEKFDEKDSFDKLLNYITTYNRIFYSPISSKIYNCHNYQGVEEANTMIDTILLNIEKLVEYTNSIEYEQRLKCNSEQVSDIYLEDTKKSILKIWDHINLAQLQYSALKQSDDEYKRKFDTLISTYKEEMSKDLNSQLLTMVSIFTALSFLIFGGISSLDNIFSTNGIPLLKLLCIGSLWGFCILNLIFVFLFCVGKMTKLNFKSSLESDATIFQKYPIVWWTDLMLFAFMILFGWGYFIEQVGLDIWIRNSLNLHPKLVTFIGTIIVSLFIFILAKFLARKTVGKEFKKNKK